MASKTTQLRADEATRLYAFFLVTTDVAMAALAFALAYFVRGWIPLPEPAEGMGSWLVHVPMMGVHVLSVVAVFFFAKLYALSRASRVDEFSGVLVGSTIATLMGVALDSLVLRDSIVGLEYSRVMILYAWLFTIILTTIGRLANDWLRRRLTRAGWGRRSVLIVGTGDVARMILQKILWSPELGYDTVGVIAMVDPAPEELLGVPVLGRASELGRIVEEQAVDEVIIALPEDTAHRDVLWLISQCERGRVTIRVYPDLFQIMAGVVSISELGGLPILTVRDIALQGWRRTAKRVMDVALSAASLIVLSPMMLLICALIRLESAGQVFYVQERMGLDARPFPIIKFRSMRSDAEKSGPGWTMEGDPRRTRVGTFLRRTNLDELPQFINVLLGDMSLVGPRPERPVYVEQFRRNIPRYMERHLEKAGVTGWAQVNGYRGDTSIIERTKYDLWYIENWSLLLDIKIMIRTVLQIFRSPNAY
jgi:exopolysaccharide biosynthesis polyprenyl glycosylphosphotransferase